MTSRKMPRDPPAAPAPEATPHLPPIGDRLELEAAIRSGAVSPPEPAQAPSAIAKAIFDVCRPAAPAPATPAIEPSHTTADEWGALRYHGTFQRGAAAPAPLSAEFGEQDLMDLMAVHVPRQPSVRMSDMIARAREEGRRAGVEEAARYCDAQADANFGDSVCIGTEEDWALERNAFRFAAMGLRALAAAPSPDPAKGDHDGR